MRKGGGGGGGGGNASSDDNDDDGGGGGDDNGEDRKALNTISCETLDMQLKRRRRAEGNHNANTK